MTPVARLRTLVLLRHGESVYNARGIFTGLLDVPLTALGRSEARHAARLLTEAHLLPDVAYTSVLRRATETADIVCDALGRRGMHIHLAWQLNERNYGALTGLSKSSVLADYGPENFLLWRRTLDGQPPPMAPTLLDEIRAQPAFAHVPPEVVTLTESLDDVRERIEPFWSSHLRRELEHGGRVLVVAHGNSLRALCAILDGLDEQEIVELNIPTGYPLVYEFDDRMRVVARGGRYLDPEAARAAAQKVSAQGGT